MHLENLRRRRILGAVVLVAGLLIGFFGVMALAQAPVERADPAAELIGAPVFSAEGSEVGTVSAVSVSADGQISEIRLTTASPLGLGTRTVAIPQGSFMALDGAVVLDLSAAEVDAMPTQPAALQRKTSA